MRVGIVIQARLGSKRLPRKVLLPLPNGKTVLQTVVESARKTGYPVVLTTPDQELKDLDLCETYLERPGSVGRAFKEVCKKYGFDTVVRITADCPMIRPQDIFYAVSWFSFPHWSRREIKTSFEVEPWSYIYFGPDGRDVEVFTAKVLNEAPEDSEHVTGGLKKDILSLDTQEDYEKICQLMQNEDRNSD